MRNKATKLLAAVGAASLAFLLIGAVVQKSDDFWIVSSADGVKLKAFNNGTQTQNWLEFGSQTQIVFAVGSAGGMTTNLICLAGDGTATNRLWFSYGILTNVTH